MVNFVFPSSGNRTGGIVVPYEFANALSRRGNEVHFLHGPAWPTRIESLDELPAQCFGHGVHHHLFDSFDDPALPAADIVFAADLPARLGLPSVFVQGFRMLSEEWERDTYRNPIPKFCVARWLVDVGLTFGVPPEQLMYVPPGLDHDLFALRTPLDERTIDVSMLYHPHREKGAKVGMEVLAELSRRRPGFRGVVFSRLQPGPLPDGVEFREALDHPTLADEVFNRCRVFMQTSVHEGFGLTPVEAMGCGSALVTTDCGGSRDYAIHDETALVVEPNDPSALVDAVEILLDDDEHRLRIARAGERYVRRFDWDA